MNLIFLILISLVSIAICDVEVVSESITGYPKNPDIKNTSFTCADKPGDGFYADIEADCQSFHMCQGGHFESFLCPTGTTFSQKGQVCDFFYNVDCSTTAAFYHQPASVNVDSLDTVVAYQTIHEDGFVVPPKPVTESESIVEESLEPLPEFPATILPIPDETVPVIPLVEPPLQEFPTVIPLIQPIAEPSQPILTTESTDVPIIQSVEPTNSPTTTNQLQQETDDVALLEGDFATKPEAATETYSTLEPSKEEAPVEDTDKITFPQNDDEHPFFNPIDHKASDVSYPADTLQEKADHYLFTLPPIQFLPHAEIDVARPLPSTAGLRALPAVYQGIPQPHISLLGQEVKSTKETLETVDVPQPRVELEGDKVVSGEARLSLPVPEVVAPHPVVKSKYQLFQVPQPIITQPQPSVEYRPIFYKMGHTLRVLQPIIKALPFLYKVPQATIGDAHSQSTPVRP